MRFFENNPTNNGHQDPFYKIQQVLQVYCVQKSIGCTFHFPMLNETMEKLKKYQLHVQLYKFSTLEPKDWLPEIKFIFNGHTMELPKVDSSRF
jgi:hypothetical protein